MSKKENRTITEAGYNVFPNLFVYILLENMKNGREMTKTSFMKDQYMICPNRTFQTTSQRRELTYLTISFFVDFMAENPWEAQTFQELEINDGQCEGATEELGRNRIVNFNKLNDIKLKKFSGNPEIPKKFSGNP